MCAVAILCIYLFIIVIIGIYMETVFHLDFSYCVALLCYRLASLIFSF